MTPAIDSRCRALLTDAAEWRLLSLLFDCPEGAWRQHVAALDSEVEDAELRACAGLALQQASTELYHSTLGPGGPASPREVSYCDALQFGYLMSELRAYYDAFGYVPHTRESPDHVSVEAGFLAFMRMKEAFARECGEPEHANMTAQAAAQFCREHLSRIAEPLGERLAESELAYLSGAGKALRGRVGSVHYPTAAATTGLQVWNDEGTFSCGAVDSNSEDV